MQHRDLGASGISASVVGLGTWAMGGWMWGGTDEDDSIRAIHAALDAGINLVDTAAIYGFGLSELVVGKAIHDRRDKVVLATKCGLICGGDKGVHKFNSTGANYHPHGHIRVHVYQAAESICREVEDSLVRLQTDYIDLYQTHWQDPTTPVEETMSALEKLKKQGKIRAIGVSNASIAHMDEYRAHGRLDCDQELYSMLDRQLDAEQLPYCLAHNVAVLAYSPLAQGLLTGKIGPDRTFGPGDLRSTKERFSVDNRRHVAEMLEQFKPVADAQGCTLGQLAIAWTAHQPGLTHVLCGARDVAQVKENAGAGDIRLDDAQLQLMNKAIEEYASQIA